MRRDMLTFAVFTFAVVCSSSSIGSAVASLELEVARPVAQGSERRWTWPLGGFLRPHDPEAQPASPDVQSDGNDYDEKLQADGHRRHARANFGHGKAANSKKHKSASKDITTLSKRERTKTNTTDVAKRAHSKSDAKGSGIAKQLDSIEKVAAHWAKVEQSSSADHRTRSMEAHKKTSNEAQKKTSSKAQKTKSTEAQKSHSIEAEKKRSSESEEKTSIVAEEQRSAEAEEQTSTESEEQTSSEAEEKTSGEAEEKTSTEAKEKTSTKAEEKTSTEAEEKTSTEAEEKTSTEAEEKRSTETGDKTSTAEEKTSIEAEETTSTEAEAKTSHDAEEKTSHDAEAKMSTEAEEETSPAAEEKMSPQAKEKTSPEGRETASPEALEMASPEAQEMSTPDSQEMSAPDAQKTESLEAQDGEEVRRSSVEGQERKSTRAQKVSTDAEGDEEVMKQLGEYYTTNLNETGVQSLSKFDGANSTIDSAKSEAAASEVAQMERSDGDDSEALNNESQVERTAKTTPDASEEMSKSIKRLVAHVERLQRAAPPDSELSEQVRRLQIVAERISDMQGAEGPHGNSDARHIGEIAEKALELERRLSAKMDGKPSVHSTRGSRTKNVTAYEAEDILQSAAENKSVVLSGESGDAATSILRDAASQSKDDVINGNDDTSAVNSGDSSTSVPERNRARTTTVDSEDAAQADRAPTAIDQAGSATVMNGFSEIPGVQDSVHPESTEPNAAPVVPDFQHINSAKTETGQRSVRSVNISVYGSASEAAAATAITKTSSAQDVKNKNATFASAAFNSAQKVTKKVAHLESQRDELATQLQKAVEDNENMRELMEEAADKLEVAKDLKKDRDNIAMENKRLVKDLEEAKLSHVGPLAATLTSTASANASIHPPSRYLGLKHIAPVGGTFATALLTRMTKELPVYFPDQGEFYRYYDQLSPINKESDQRNMFLISMVRNPCDWYVTSWTHAAKYDAAALHQLFGTEDDPEPFFSNDNLNRTKFANWLQWAQGDWKAGEKSSSNSNSVMSLRYWEAFVSGKPVGGLNQHGYNGLTLDKFTHYFDSSDISRQTVDGGLQELSPKSVIDCWVEAEHYMQDVNHCLSKYEHASGAKLDWRPFTQALINKGREGIPEKEPEHEVCDYYYTPELAASVMHHDRHLFEAFGYDTCCGPTRKQMK